MENKSNNKIFDYRALRLLMGLIALCLPFIVSFVASNKLPSISASYHSEARDAFVGMLFVTSAFLWAYNGHTTLQKVLSKLASIAAILVAVSPLHCSGCEVNLASTIHSISTAVLFSVLSYFCFSPFRKNTKGKGGKKGLRSKIYFMHCLTKYGKHYVLPTMQKQSHFALSGLAGLLLVNGFGF
jgi:hypothetical protein